MFNLNVIALMVLSTYAPSDEPAIKTCQVQYEPFSPEAKALFAEVAPSAGVPRSWAYSPGLHYILRKESNGQVGIPNYSIKDEDNRSVRDKPHLWPDIHQRIKQGEKGSPKATSSATGLGQLLLANADRFYPSGRDGIGDCREEAQGMLSYIRAVYGSPNTAWSCYGKLRPEECPKKQFREGY